MASKGNVTRRRAPAVRGGGGGGAVGGRGDLGGGGAGARNGAGGGRSGRGSGTGGALAVLCVWAVTIMALAASRATHLVPPPVEPATAAAARTSAVRAHAHVEQLAGASGVVARESGARAGFRHMGTEGLHIANAYVTDVVSDVAARAARERADLDVSVSVRDFSGVVAPQRVLNRVVANAYTNVTVVALRVAAKGAPLSSPSVVLNAHTDSTLGTAGASDCAACVASLLEAARAIIDGAGGGTPPAAPLLFVFNGGEETFSQGAHGWLQHEWANAGRRVLINLESTGPSAPLVLFQTRGRWPVEAYAAAAMHPSGTAAGQDLFVSGALPVDSDFSVLASVWGAGEGRMEGINLASVLDGYAYHTDRDSAERLPLPVLQTMADTVLSVGLEFATRLAAGEGHETPEAVDAHRAAYTDVLSAGVLVVGTEAGIAALAWMPLLFALGVPAVARAQGESVGQSYSGLASGARAATVAILAAIACPALLAVAWAALPGIPMGFYSRPYSWAVGVFAPASVGGVVLTLGGARSAGLALRDGVRGVALVLAALAALVASVGGVSSYMTALPSVASTIAALLLAPSVPAPAEQQMRAGRVLAVVAILTLPAAMNASSFIVLIQFFGEKLGMAGSLPAAAVPMWLSVPDLGLGAVTGIGLVLTFASAAPWAVACIAKPRRTGMGLVLAAAVAATTLTATTPNAYTAGTPKRLVLAHVHGVRLPGDGGEVPAPFFALAGLDSSPLSTVLDATHVSSPLLRASGDAWRTAKPSGLEWLSVYPVNDLLHDTVVFPNAPRLPSEAMPSLRVVSNATLPNGRVRFELEHVARVPLFLAALVQGPLKAWSLSQELVAETDGFDTWSNHQPYFAARHCGGKDRGGERFAFWLEREADAKEPLQLRVAGAATPPAEENEELQNAMSALPEWTAAIPATVYHSELTL